MNWQTLLEQQSNTDIGPITDRQLLPLPGMHVLRVSGEDAGMFLQNMLTNDVNALQPNQAQLSGLCNPKGRLLGIFILVRRTRDYLLLIPADIADTLRQRLTMFILRSKVTIEDISTEQVVFSISSAEENVIAGLPTADWQGVEQDDVLMIRQPGQPTRLLCIAGPESAVKIIDDLMDKSWQLAAESHWQLLNIDAGLPMVFRQSQEQFTPQQLNLDLIGGVSFKKGCYPGQEVVARLHYLGAPSRRLFLATMEAEHLPDPASPVEDKNGEVLGHVVQAQFSDKRQIRLQLSMKLSSLGTEGFIDTIPIMDLTALAEEAHS